MLVFHPVDTGYFILATLFSEGGALHEWRVVPTAQEAQETN